MAKLKTMVERLKDGYEDAFCQLDRKVESLGKVDIEDVKDSVHPTGGGLERNTSSYIERIIIHEETKKVDGQPWRPVLDTDLMDFLGTSQPDHRVREAIEESMNKGRKPFGS